MQIIKEKIKKSALFILILFLCTAISAIILDGVKQFQISSQLASINQVANLSHLLVRQQTNLFSILLMNNASTDKLTESLEKLAKENLVLDASLYAGNGELLAQSSHSLSLRQQLNLEDNPNMSYQQIVEPIYSVNGLEGFLRVSFDSSYGQKTQYKINQIFHRLYGEFAIIFLTGLLFASTIHYFLSHYRRLRNNNATSVKVVQSKISSAAAYHRRRRRWR